MTEQTSPLAAKFYAVFDLAVQLMKQYGLKDWIFKFNRRKRDLGICYAPHRGRPGRIELSIYFVHKNSEAEIRDTILHEIAHALVGQEHGHDNVWKAKCMEIGATPKRCGKAEMPMGNWRATCPGCQTKFHRHRRPKRMTGCYCRACGPTKGQIVWNYGSTPVKPA
jgi:predicted SprT family Zn-dependent metalloprotease